MAELDQEGGEGKSAKKLIIMIVAAVLLVAAGGGVTFFLLKKDDAPGEKVEHVEEEEEVQKEKAYFDMSKPIVIDFPQGAAMQHGRIALSMLAEDAETAEILKKNEPMIRNNLMMLIGGQDVAALNTREGKEALRKQILDSVNSVVEEMDGKGQVEEIFFTSFVMQ
ncbi:MAG: flagellar basal body-associated FliL family protein [Methylobacter sp.]